MNSDFVIEAESICQAKSGQTICGDTILIQKIKEENRIVTVMSDGLGSGVQANISATMTTSMALQFTISGDTIERAAEFITRTLPTDPLRKVSYATFSILDINYRGEVKAIEYDNPPLLLFRRGKFIDLKKQETTLDNIQSSRNKLYQYKFSLEKDDRIIMVSDGISQCGMGTVEMHFGWQTSGLKNYVQQQIECNPTISARELARSIMGKCIKIDNGQLKDDAACCVLYYRRPRKLLVVSGPPYHKEKDKYMASCITEFKGTKIICGGTTAKIIARELNTDVEIDLNNYVPGLPPKAKMKGVDLVTEGIITLAKVSEELNNYTATKQINKGLSTTIIKMMMDNDEIHFISGTRVNNAHQDPDLPVELEIRRNVINKIANTLENNFLKKTIITFI